MREIFEFSKKLCKIFQKIGSNSPENCVEFIQKLREILLKITRELL